MRLRYAGAVAESQNEVRMRPRDDTRQRLHSYRLTSRPPARLLQVFDYWGTAVDHLGVREPHHELELLAEASVETTSSLGPHHDVPLSVLTDAALRSQNFELLVPSQHVRFQPGDDVEQRARAAARDSLAVPDLIRAVVADASCALRYERGSTDIGVSLCELLANGAGVCQDFAHLAIGMLRSVGVPARYVSGYLFAADETALDNAADSNVADADPDYGSVDEVSVQTHAWIEAAVPGFGWWPLDPTNGSDVGERHVVIGYGRDYGDVPPFRGAFTGPATTGVDAEVVIGRSSRRDVASEHRDEASPASSAGQQQQ